MVVLPSSMITVPLFHLAMTGGSPGHAAARAQSGGGDASCRLDALTGSPTPIASVCSVLKNIDPLLSPELLHALAKMGHGDFFAIVDRNFPAYQAERPVVRLDGVDTNAALEAILSVFPLDTFVDEPIARMGVVDDPDSVPEVAADTQRIATEAEGREIGVRVVERHAFYEETGRCAFVLATGETRSYGCFFLTKGVL